MAAKNGDMKTLTWLRVLGCQWNENTFYLAAKYGHLDMLKWIYDVDPLFPYSSCIIATGAAKGGHIAILEWIKSINSININPQFLCAGAAAYGQLEVLKYYSQQLHEFINDPMLGQINNDIVSHINNWHAADSAALGGKMEVLKWFREIGCHIPNSAVGYATIGGHLHIIKWLLDDTFQWSYAGKSKVILQSTMNAIRYGHSLVLEFFKVNWSMCEQTLRYDDGSLIFSDFEDAMRITKWISLQKKLKFTGKFPQYMQFAKDEMNRHNENFAKYTTYDNY